VDDRKNSCPLVDRSIGWQGYRVC